MGTHLPHVKAASRKIVDEAHQCVKKNADMVGLKHVLSDDVISLTTINFRLFALKLLFRCQDKKNG